MRDLYFATEEVQQSGLTKYIQPAQYIKYCGGLIWRKIPIYEAILANFNSQKNAILSMKPTILQLMVTQRVERNRFLGFSQIRKFLLNKSADWWSQHGAPVRTLCFIQYL